MGFAYMNLQSTVYTAVLLTTDKKALLRFPLPELSVLLSLLSAISSLYSRTCRCGF